MFPLYMKGVETEMTLYTLPGCPMCDLLADRMAQL